MTLAGNVFDHGPAPRHDGSFGTAQGMHVGLGRLRAEIISCKWLAADAHFDLVSVPGKFNGFVAAPGRRNEERKKKNEQDYLSFRHEPTS